MKALTAVLTITSSLFLTQAAQAQRHHHHSNSNNAAITGLVVGTVVGNLLSSALQPRYYAYPQPVYVQPLAPIFVPTTPVYQVQPSACQTIRVPVFDRGGRLVEYVQQCAN